MQPDVEILNEHCIMNEINIMHTSEKVWHMISESERISLSELATKLNISIEIAALSAGWLAVEDKIYIRENGTSIELSPKNHHPIYFG